MPVLWAIQTAVRSELHVLSWIEQNITAQPSTLTAKLLAATWHSSRCFIGRRSSTGSQENLFRRTQPQ